MELLIKKIPLGTIFYVKTMSGQNIEAKIATNKDEENSTINEFINLYNIIKITDNRSRNISYNVDDSSPLILTFYLQEDTLSTKGLVEQISKSMDELFEERNLNAIVLFVPTKNEEKIECINPVILPKDEIERVNVVVDDIRKSFSV